MKINWGTGIIISFILFAGFIGYLAIRIQTHPDYEHDLVVKNYYEEELHYNQKRQAQSNASEWSANLQLEKATEYLNVFELPSNQDIKIKGYCPSDSKKDFYLSQKTDSMGVLRLSHRNFIQGNWTLTFFWTAADQEFEIVTPYYH